MRIAMSAIPEKHHIDKRADLVAAQINDSIPSALLSTAEVSRLIGYSTQWLEIGRHRGYGPPFIRVGPRRIRYRGKDLLAWLDERRHRCTDEYMKPPRTHRRT
jgi:hypothetical protein